LATPAFGQWPNHNAIEHAMSRRERWIERQWLTSGEPAALLDCLIDLRRDFDRQLRWFALACGRLLWPLLTDPRSRAAVEIAEQHQMSGVEEDRIREAAEGATEAGSRLFAERARRMLDGTSEPPESAAYFIWQLLAPTTTPMGVARQALELFGVSLRPSSLIPRFARGSGIGKDDLSIAPKPWLCRALRCIFGNPCRTTVVDPTWLHDHDGRVPKLAHALREELAFERMPILGDALEDAGCTDTEMLAHCREPGEHCRGCYVLDLILAEVRCSPRERDPLLAL
jgi:hypothetical protein